MASSSLGTDISVFPDLGKRFRLVSERANIAEAALKRLTTPRGKLHYAPDYGYDLRRFVNESSTPDVLTSVRANVTAELLKDARILSAVASVTYDDASEKLTVALALTDADGPFKLVLTATADLVELLHED